MTDAIPSYNPEVVRLLAEALRLPDSIFQRLSRMRPKRLFEPPLSVGTSFLSNKERYLLRWHREEVGRLLYEGCMLTLQGPVEKTKTIFAKKVVDESAWQRGCARVLRSTKPCWPKERGELRKTNDSGGLGSRAAQLALALAPSDDVRLALSSALFLEGELRLAGEAAEGVVTKSRSSRQRSIALTVLADEKYQCSDYRGTMDLYRRAANERSPTPIASIFWLAHALRLGNPTECSKAALAMRDQEEHVEVVLEDCLNLLRRERESGAWVTEPRSASSSTLQISGHQEEKVFDAIR